MKKPWERAPLDEAVFLQEGPGIRSYEYQKGGYPMINVRCVQDGYIDLSTCNAANVELATGKWKHFQVQEGDILFTISGSIGRTAIVKKKDLPLLMNTSVVRFRSKTQRLRDDFFFYYLQSEDFLGKLHALSSGTAQKNVGPTHLKTLDVPLPPLAEQQRIVGLLNETFEGLATAKANAEKNLQNARALFESLLQSVFTQRCTGWVEKRLGDEALIEIIDGDRGVNYPNGSDFQDEGYCLFMNTKNVRPDGFEFESTMFITEEKDQLLRKGKLKRDDVVLTTRGTIGNVGIYSEDVPFDNIRINSGMLIFRPNKSALLPAFLFELFRSEIVKEQIRKQTTGAAQPQLPIKTLVNFTIPVPTKLADQAALVKKIRAFEPETQRLARLYEQKLAALEALKKSLLHEAFAGEL